MTEFEKLGPYIIKGKLGQGGMGAVYRGQHEETGELAAIKVIASHVANKEKFRNRFNLEIETLKKLNHPNIVSMTGYGEEAGHLFFAMDLIEGPSLQSHLRSEKRIHWDQVIQYGVDICSALKHAHDLGVIHRDLKPANLLMGPDDHLLVTDFGIARLWGRESVTAEGAMLGTADYMAPEQASGGPINVRTDLYALGNVMYACLVGRPPFGGKQLTKVITSLQTELPPPIDLILPELPHELSLLIHQLLEKDQAKRPPTALAVGNRLRSMRQGLNRGHSTQADDDGVTLASFDIDVGTSEGSAEVAADLPTDERPTMDAAPAGASGTGSNAGTEETLDSFEPELPESQTFTPQTHFRTVDQEERLKAVAPATTEESEERSYETVLSAAGLILLLVLLVAGAVYMTRAPSADQLHAQILRGEDAGDLASVSRQIDEFLHLYAEDERAEDVSLLADQLDSERVLRRIRTKARVKGKDRLDPAELAFLSAMAYRENEPEKTRELLLDWIVVFGHAPARDTAKSRLIPVVSQEIELIEQNVDSSLNQRSERLLSWIDQSLEGRDPEQSEVFLKAVRRLYADEVWAKDVVLELDNRLAKVSAE